MSRIPLTAARKFQIRAFTLFGARGHVAETAKGTEYSADYIGRIFNENVPLTSEAAAKIEAFLSEQERTHELQHAA